MWSVTGIAASSFTLDLIQPLQDKAVSTIPFLLRNTQHKALIEVNRRCKAAFLMVRRLEVELYLRDGGGRIPLLVSKRSADVSALRSSELGKRGEEGYREK